MSEQTPVPTQGSASGPVWSGKALKIRINGTMTGRGPEVYIDEPHYEGGGELVVADCGTSEHRPGGVGRWKRMPDADTLEAYANLFQHAPELYAALEQMDRYFGSMAGGCEQESEDAIKQCRAALAKARGTSPE